MRLFIRDIIDGNSHTGTKELGELGHFERMCTMQVNDAYVKSTFNNSLQTLNDHDHVHDHEYYP